VGGVGRSARTRTTALLPPRSSGKPEAATAVVKLLMMGIRMPETCWAVFKRQAINLRICCIWLVDSFERSTLSCIRTDYYSPWKTEINIDANKILYVTYRICVNWRCEEWVNEKSSSTWSRPLKLAHKWM